MSPDLQPVGVLHVGVDNYFTVFRKSEDGGGAFPTDLGVTLGVATFGKFQLELGLDVLESSDDPLYLNAKVGTAEGALFQGAPAFQLGLANAGTNRGSTDYNIVYFVIGKTFPSVGRFSIAPYVGNADLLRDGAGEKEDSGLMVAFDRGFGPLADASGSTFNRWVLAADYASGDNALGGGGVGLAYFFTRDVSLLTGPVWFNDKSINGEWKWTVQLDINASVFHR